MKVIFLTKANILKINEAPIVRLFLIYPENNGSVCTRAVKFSSFGVRWFTKRIHRMMVYPENNGSVCTRAVKFSSFGVRLFTKRIHRMMVYIFVPVVILTGFYGPVIAQEMESNQTVQTESIAEEAEETPAAVRLEELEIRLPGLEVLFIPRREVELPPVKFGGMFKSSYLQPASDLFTIKEKDLKPMGAKELGELLVKARN